MAPEVIQNSEGYNEKVFLRAAFGPICLHVTLLRLSIVPHTPFLDAGWYLVFGDNCNWDGKRGTSTGWYSPYEGSFYDTSRKSTAGFVIILTSEMITLDKECRVHRNSFGLIQTLFFTFKRNHDSCAFYAAWWAFFPSYERICFAVFKESTCRGK